MSPFFIQKIFAKELIKEGIDYVLTLETWVGKESISRRFNYNIKSKDERIKNAIDIDVENLVIENSLTDGLEAMDHVTLWWFGFASTEPYHVKDAAKYVKFALTNRLYYMGTNKETKAKEGSYIDFRDFGEIEGIISEISEEIIIDEAYTFDGRY